MSDMPPVFDRDGLRAELTAQLEHFASLGYSVKPLVFERCATPDEVDHVEALIGAELPGSFRRVLTEVSRHVHFGWSTRRDISFPDPFRNNFCGELHWSLREILDVETARRDWIDQVFPNPSDPYDIVWHNKLAFCNVPNGDQLAFDSEGNVVYLSHDGGEGHGFTMAPSFDELLNRWVPLACTGSECWQWMPFTTNANSGIDPSGEAATTWRSLLNLESLRP